MGDNERRHLPSIMCGGGGVSSSHPTSFPAYWNQNPPNDAYPPPASSSAAARASATPAPPPSTSITATNRLTNLSGNVARSSVPYRQPSFPQRKLQPSHSYSKPALFVPLSMSWNWDGAVDYTGVSEYYEPQGELVQDQQEFPTADFNTPYFVAGQQYQSPPNFSAAANTPANPNYQSPQPPIVTQQPGSEQIGMKRKAGSSEAEITSSSVSTTISSDLQPPTKVSKPLTAPYPTDAGISNASVSRPAESRPTASRQHTQEGAGSPFGGITGDAAENTQRKGSNTGVQSGGNERSMSGMKRRVVDSSGPVEGVLPASKVFPIQVGSELFRLSGASISSDAPSYFTHFFGEQLSGHPSKAGELKTLYIDRDPAIFRDIVLHLQGYYVGPHNSEHFVRLFADAQFYSLPRLTQQLFKSEIFVEVGGQDFRIPRDLFSAPGDTPNFFSLGFAHFFSTPKDVFPGLDRTTLLRPPSILPPHVNNRSGKIFCELVRLLQGYPLNVENEGHRAELLRDARYYHLKGVEQRILPCNISYNHLRGVPEIVIRLEDMRQSGVSFIPDAKPEATPAPSSTAASSGSKALPKPGFVFYARPYTDEEPHLLILEVNALETTKLHFSAGTTPGSAFIHATFVKDSLARISSLFQVIANKMGLPATQALGLMLMETGGGVAAQPVSPANSGISGARVKMRIDADSYVELDGQQIHVDPRMVRAQSCNWASPRLVRSKWKKRNDDDAVDEREEMEDIFDFEAGEEISWIVKRSQWRLRIVPAGEPGRVEVVMVAVRLEAFTSERGRNQSRGFLS